MRLLHAADLHLGRTLRSVSHLDDQAAAMDALVLSVQETRSDLLVVVAGDILVAFTPPQLALNPLDDTLTRLVRSLGIRILLLAGHHDDSHRLGVGAHLPDTNGLHVTARLGLHRILAGDGEVLALPLADPSTVPAALDLPKPPPGHNTAISALLVGLQAPRRFLALAAYLFIQRGLLSEAENERLTAVGTIERIRPETLATAGAHAVLLGHLHALHAPYLGIWYVESPLPLSFNEAGPRQSLAPLKIVQDETVQHDLLPFDTGHPGLRIPSRLTDLLAHAATDPTRDAWTLAELTDTVPPWYLLPDGTAALDASDVEPLVRVVHPLLGLAAAGQMDGAVSYVPGLEARLGLRLRVRHERQRSSIAREGT